MKLHTLLENFDFPNGFVADLDTKEIYLSIERVGSKVLFPHFINKFGRDYHIQDTHSTDYIARMLTRHWQLDPDIHPILITRNPYARFVSAFEVMFYQDRHIPEDLFDFQFRKLHPYFFLDPEIYNRKNTQHCVEVFERFTEFVCSKPITYNFVKPITSYFKDVDILSDINCVDLEVYAQQNNIPKKLEKRTSITIEEYFQKSGVRHCFENKFANDFERFCYQPIS